MRVYDKYISIGSSERRATRLLDNQEPGKLSILPLCFLALDLFFSCSNLYLSSRVFFVLCKLGHLFLQESSFLALFDLELLEILGPGTFIFGNILQATGNNKPTCRLQKLSTPLKFTYRQEYLALCHVLLNELDLVRQQFWLLCGYKRGGFLCRQRTPQDGSLDT